MPTASALSHYAAALPRLIGGSSSPDAKPAARTVSAHILVVDDEPDISALVAYHLARESYRVRTAASGPFARRSTARTRATSSLVEKGLAT